MSHCVHHDYGPLHHYVSVRDPLHRVNVHDAVRPRRRPNYAKVVSS